MSTTNIDRSLDDIIKDQRKLKRKTQKLKAQQSKKKGAQQQQQGKKQARRTVPSQNRGRRSVGKQNAWPAQQGQGTQRRKRALTRKQNQSVQQGGGKQNNRRKQNANFANRAKAGGARVTANRLKYRQGSLQKTKKIVSKAKQIQQNRRLVNRQNRQTQQKDARQNILNKRRGMQGAVKGNKINKVENARNWSSRNSGTPKLQRINRRGNPAPQLTVSINNPQVRLNRNPSNQGNMQGNRRRWRGGFRAGGSMDTGDLRISVSNNLYRPPPLRPLKPLQSSGYESPVGTASPGKSFATLNERFSNIPQRGTRTIVID